MKLTIALVVFCLSTAAVYARTYTYSCKVCVFPSISNNGDDGCEEVGGNTYPLQVDDQNNVLEWRRRRYRLTVASAEPNGCARIGWHAEGNGTSFKFCTATQGYAAIEDNDGNVRVRCNLKR